jgi:hypothetical protein
MQIFGPARAITRASGRAIVFLSVSGFFARKPSDRLAYVRFEQSRDHKQIGLTLSAADWRGMRNRIDLIFANRPDARS